MPNNEFIGRRKAVGLGIESSAGTGVAPSFWYRHMSLDFQRKVTAIQNQSAMGRNEKVNDSAIVEEWAEGDFEGKLYDLSIGPLLYNVFGTLVTTDNPDTNAAVKDHTLDVAQSNIAKTLTIARVDPIATRRHAYGTLENLEFTAEQGGWVMVKGSLQALAGATASDTAAYVAENSFTSKHVTVKIASNVAGLAGASALAIKNLRLTISRDTMKFFPHGSIDPSVINIGPFAVEGELVLRYDSNSLENLWFANTQQALQITIVNTDVTIGAAARPGLVFTLPKVRLNTFDMSDDLDEIVEQTVGFTAELSVSDGYMIRGVLTNTQSAY
jgi:hypothetical protein